MNLEAHAVIPSWASASSGMAVLSNGVQSLSHHTADVASHAEDAGHGLPETRLELLDRLKAWGESQVTLLNQDDDEPNPSVITTAILYSKAILAVDSLVIIDKHLRDSVDVTMAIMDFALTFAPAEPVGANELRSIIDDALEALKGVEPVEFKTQAAYSARIADDLRANGKNVCTHLEHGYVTEDLDPEAPVNQFRDLMKGLEGGLDFSGLADMFGDDDLFDDDEDEDDIYDA